MLLYRELVDWYRLVDPPADHADEAAAYQAALERAAAPRPETLLEIGAGAGHNALHLKRRFRCTLADLSPEMSALSRELNPDCEHVLGDMRTLRLGRTFDAVLLHDAVMYMTSEADLRAAIETAFVHLRPGGAAVFAPDWVRETFREQTNLLEAEDGGRALRGIEWSWDPDPSDDTYIAEYAFLLRDGMDVRSVHDRHVEGVFSRATWMRLLEEAGFRVATFARPLDDETFDEVFVGTR
ncbi:MAG TPA: class I SAM-dependent methyltransferase [Thermoanaerobaculia bacterium]